MNYLNIGNKKRKLSNGPETKLDPNIINNLVSKLDDNPLDLMDIHQKFNIKTIGSNIYFYESITQDTILTLKEHIELLSLELKEQGLKYKFDPIIYLYIYSPGGDIHMGFSGYEFIKNNKIPI